MTRRRKLFVLAGILLGLGVVGAAGFFAWTRYGQGGGAPVVGISLSSDWYDVTRLNPAPYAAALARAGANVVTLGPEDLDHLDRVDGLLLVGGGDVDPALFGGSPSKAYRVDRKHDDFEIELLKRAEARGLPVLAICRGSQLLAVAYGGKLRSLESEPELAKRHGITLRSFSAHAVRIKEGSRLHAILGEGPYTVSSTHLQAIDDSGPKLKIAAVAEDGVIEAVELPGPRFVVGIQWHPELDSVTDSRPLASFRLLVAEASHRRAAR